MTEPYTDASRIRELAHALDESIDLARDLYDTLREVRAECVDATHRVKELEAENARLKRADTDHWITK